MTAPQHVVTSDFHGVLVPADVQQRILNLLVDGAPFGSSLTRQPTTSNKVTYPVAAPSGFAWLGELQQFPTVSLNDDAVTVAVAKIGGIVDLSNELVDDSTFNVTTAFGQLLSDSLSADLDEGLLNGSGPPEPAGVIAAAEAVAGASLYAAAMTARGEIGDSGGQATTLAASASTLAAADSTMSGDGLLVFPNGVAAALGLQAVAVPGLATPLVYDSTRCFLVINGQLSQVDLSRDWHFNLDATSCRVKARVACAIPVPAKAIRKLTVAGGTSAAKATAKTGRG